MWLELARRRSRKPEHVGANPAVGSYWVNHVTNCVISLQKFRLCVVLLRRLRPAKQHKTNTKSLWSVPDRTRLCESRRPGSIPGRDIPPKKTVTSDSEFHDADARWSGGCLQHSSKRVRFPSASLVRLAVGLFWEPAAAAMENALMTGSPAAGLKIPPHAHAHAQNRRVQGELRYRFEHPFG